MKRKSFLVSVLALVMLVLALLISAPTAASDRDDDDDDDNYAADCPELLIAFGKQLNHFNALRIKALAKAPSDPEEIGEVWAEYFEELADLVEDFGEDLADAKCPFPSL